MRGTLVLVKKVDSGFSTCAGEKILFFSRGTFRRSCSHDALKRLYSTVDRYSLFCLKSGAVEDGYGDQVFCALFGICIIKAVFSVNF